MASIETTTEFEFQGQCYEASGRADFSGPYYEFDGISNLVIHLADCDIVPSKELVRAANEALEDAAREDLEEEIAESQSYDDDYRDYGDDYYSSGPDYWIDRESGEYRCG